MIAPRCPFCHTPTRRTDAAPAGKTRPGLCRDDLHTCPTCRRLIQAVVPLFKISQAGWHWQPAPPTAALAGDDRCAP